MGIKEEEAVESREDETCMNNGEAGEDGSKKGPKWQAQMVGMWSRAKNLSHDRLKLIILILALFIFILLILVIVLGTSLSGFRCAEPPPTCGSGLCLAAASAVKHSMDLSRSPCRDMWNYSCGDWLSSYQDHLASGSWEIEDELRDSLDHELRKLIDTITQGVENNSPLHKLHRFYLSCMDVEGLEHWPLNQLKEIIYELRGWRLLNNWQASVWNRNDVLAQLHANYAIEAFFTVDVEWDDLTSKNIIKIKPGGLGLPSKDIYFRPLTDPLVKAYKEFISNALQVLKITNAIEAPKFADEMYSFEIRIAKMSPNRTELRDRSSQYQMLKLEELSTRAPMVKWQSLLEKYFPRATISPSTRVGILAPQYFSHLSRLLSTTDDTVLNDYFMWRLLMANLEHLNRNSRTVVANFHNALKGSEATGVPQEERWRYCVRLTNRHLGHAFSSLYIKSYLSPNVTHQVDKMVDQVLATLMGHVGNMPWLKEALEKEVIRNKIRGMKKEIGFPVFVLDDKALEDYYSSFEVKLTYFQNILNVVSFQRKKKESLLANPFKFSWRDNSQDPVARYYPNGNILTIGAGLLQPPFYKRGFPEPQLYGIMAHILVPSILQMVDDIGVQYQQDGLLEDWYSNATRDDFTSRFQKCTSAAEVLLPLQSGEPQMEDLVTQIGALKLAYETMERMTPDDQRAAPLPTLPLNSGQLFFVSYVQTQCQLLSPRREAILAQAQGQLPNRDQVRFVLEQTPEFWKAFECPSAPANPDCPAIW